LSPYFLPPIQPLGSVALLNPFPPEEGSEGGRKGGEEGGRKVGWDEGEGDGGREGVKGGGREGEREDGVRGRGMEEGRE